MGYQDDGARTIRGCAMVGLGFSVIAAIVGIVAWLVSWWFG